MADGWPAVIFFPVIIHTLMCYSILSCIHNHHIAVHMSQDWLKWAKYHLIFTLVIYTTHSHCTQVSCPTQASRLASRDHVVCMMDLACSGDWGAGVSVLASWSSRVAEIARHYLELDSKVSFCSRMKPLVNNLLRLNTEEGHLVIIETELEAFGCLLEQRCP